MTEINLVKELRKRGFKLTPLPPLTPEQMKHIQKTSQDVKNFWEIIDAAYRASAHSKLRFDTLIVRHSLPRRSTRNLCQKNKD